VPAWPKLGWYAGVVRTSSHGVPKDRPSTDIRACRPLPGLLPKMVPFRREAATPHTRAALAVSHGFDGLLRRVLCRFVAPCNRSWGSPRFRLPPTGSPPPRVATRRRHPGFVCLSRDALPCEVFPSSPALRRVTTADTFSPLPPVLVVRPSVLPRQCRLPLRVGPTSRSCSDAESVALPGVATR
jgi:hypothetical protein